MLTHAISLSQVHTHRDTHSENVARGVIGRPVNARHTCVRTSCTSQFRHPSLLPSLLLVRS